jgi:hypothetical protein
MLIVVLARVGAADAVTGVRTDARPALSRMRSAPAEIRDFQVFMM